MDKVANSVGPPKAEPKPAGSRGKGRPPYSPTSMLKVNLLRIYLKLSYRDMEALLAADAGMRDRLGLAKTPGQDTIHRHAETLTEAYLVKINRALSERLKKTSLTSASTPPVLRSTGTRHVGALPNPNSGKAATGSNSTR
ncbi:MAG: transposase [Candidatus Thermoplasmatota archaeon]